MEKTIFVLGAGKCCGNRVAERFGMNDFRVISVRIPFAVGICACIALAQYFREEANFYTQSGVN